MAKHTYVGDPKLVVAEKMTYFEFSGDDLNYRCNDKNGYKVSPDKGDSYWLSENEFESKFFKISGSSCLETAKKFRGKLRIHKSLKIKTDSGVEEPSLLISNAACTIFRDIAIYGFAVDK
jgi:hypothetical protein